ncbi:MAG: hypothetical protein J0G32_02855, partial [Alphaproteobacteria bacterium]|nr:hypothetical protein [Alphaproteobacteria bacterium]
MSKRRAADHSNDERSLKRLKVEKEPIDYLSALPDEMIAHILSYFAVNETDEVYSIAQVNKRLKFTLEKALELIINKLHNNKSAPYNALGKLAYTAVANKLKKKYDTSLLSDKEYLEMHNQIISRYLNFVIIKDWYTNSQFDQLCRNTHHKLNLIASKINDKTLTEEYLVGMLNGTYICNGLDDTQLNYEIGGFLHDINITKVNINQPFTMGDSTTSLLEYAYSEKNENAVKLLIKNGAKFWNVKLTIPTTICSVALMEAFLKEFTFHEEEFLDVIYKAQKILKEASPEEAITLINILQLFKGYYTDITSDEFAQKHNTFLYYASLYGYTELVNYLLEVSPNHINTRSAEELWFYKNTTFYGYKQAIFPKGLTPIMVYNQYWTWRKTEGHNFDI